MLRIKTFYPTLDYLKEEKRSLKINAEPLTIIYKWTVYHLSKKRNDENELFFLIISRSGCQVLLWFRFIYCDNYFFVFHEVHHTRQPYDKEEIEYVSLAILKYLKRTESHLIDGTDIICITDPKTAELITIK